MERLKCLPVEKLEDVIDALKAVHSQLDVEVVVLVGEGIDINGQPTLIILPLLRGEEGVVFVQILAAHQGRRQEKQLRDLVTEPLKKDLPDEDILAPPKGGNHQGHVWVVQPPRSSLLSGREGCWLHSWRQA